MIDNENFISCSHWGMFYVPKNPYAEDAGRYQFLRRRNLNTIAKGGVFAGQTPQNILLNGSDLDRAIDVELANPRRKK